MYAYRRNLIESVKTQRRGLRVIDGAQHVEMSSGPYRVVAAPRDRPPFEVGAVVLEEDTYLILSADPVVKEPQESWGEVIKQVNELQPETPGSVLIRETYPLEILAVVHDLDRDPSWKEEWIAAALDGVLREFAARGVRSGAIPMLGATHGSLALKRAAGLLREALKRGGPRTLEHIWLMRPPAHDTGDFSHPFLTWFGEHQLALSRDWDDMSKESERRKAISIWREWAKGNAHNFAQYLFVADVDVQVGEAGQ